MPCLTQPCERGCVSALRGINYRSLPVPVTNRRTVTRGPTSLLHQLHIPQRSYGPSCFLSDDCTNSESTTANVMAIVQILDPTQTLSTRFQHNWPRTKQHQGRSPAHRQRTVDGHAFFQANVQTAQAAKTAPESAANKSFTILSLYPKNRRCGFQAGIHYLICACCQSFLVHAKGVSGI